MRRRLPRGFSQFNLAEGRVISTLERQEPGIVRRFLDEMLAAGVEPTRERLRSRLADAYSRRPA